MWDNDQFYLTRAEAIGDIALHASKMGLLPIVWSEIDEKLTIGRTHKSGNSDLIYTAMVRSGQLPQGWRLVPAAESYTDCCGTLTATARLAGSDAPRHLSAPRRCRCCPGAQCQAAATARLYRARLKPDEILPRSDDDLGQRRAARLRFNVWCTPCGHRSEPEPAGQARWYCPDTTEPEGNRRLVCGKCGSRDVGFVVSGSRRDPLF